MLLMVFWQGLEDLAERQRLSADDLKILNFMIDKMKTVITNSGAYRAGDALYLGGSLGKGTGVKNQCDADIVIFKSPPFGASKGDRF